VKLETTEAFERALRKLSPSEFEIVSNALRKLPDAFGKPHLHQGLRKLRPQLYEFRAGLHRRILFRREADSLFLILLGTHEEIRRFLKAL
jgi:mRNA-degrading endonuclease RelE of RelBE toxin-antitoxin system